MRNAADIHWGVYGVYRFFRGAKMSKDMTIMALLALLLVSWFLVIDLWLRLLRARESAQNYLRNVTDQYIDFLTNRHDLDYSAALGQGASMLHEVPTHVHVPKGIVAYDYTCPFCHRVEHRLIYPWESEDHGQCDRCIAFQKINLVKS